MPTLGTFLSWLSGAGPTAIVVGFFLWRSLKKIDALELAATATQTARDVERAAWVAKLEAQAAARLADHQALIPVVANNTAALNGNTEALEQHDDPRTGRKGSR